MAAIESNQILFRSNITLPHTPFLGDKEGVSSFERDPYNIHKTSVFTQLTRNQPT